MENIERHKHEKTASFYGMGIAPSFLDILEQSGFKSPTPIQAQAIPIAIQGKDIVGIAQTGTGKTLAFGIPMLQRLSQIKGQGLIILPTRELALQIEEALIGIGRDIRLRTVVLIGGAPLGPQKRAIANKPHVIIATPGRLIDHLQQKNIHLNDVRVVVLDEADRMLDMGFAPQIKQIFRLLPGERQTMLFSATMPPEIMKMAAGHMKLPIRVEIAPTGTIVEKVTQELFIVSNVQKFSLLNKLLESYLGSVLIFTRTKHGANKIARQLRVVGISTVEIHSNRSLGQRREALAGFKSGKYRTLVATDIASRGIDVSGIELVINYDMPSTSDGYVHRIGRTARAGAGGHAITFAMPDEFREVRAIERLIRKSLPVSKLPELLLVRTVQPTRSFGSPRQNQPASPMGMPARSSQYSLYSRRGNFRRRGFRPQTKPR
ncbi:MAG: ATP-dependent RNA helicase RhlE [Parcubacteria group bacterium Licking1014_17]|nr:MAG: ATP-dependent RNA helicase RhlE [Parcubacteria group bacterium Licking1014_17]